MGVANALVELVRSGDSVRTSETGDFVFARARAGNETVRVRALGYRPKSVELQVRPDTGWAGIIVLDRVLQELPEVQVTAKGKPAEFAHTTKYDDYFRRRQLGQGLFWTRQELLDKGASDIVSIFQGIPGVSATLTTTQLNEPELRLRIARCPGNPPPLAIYVDGSKMIGRFNSGVELAEALTSIPFPRILFVEFYRGTGQLPSDVDRGDYCAALLIWTR